MKMNQQGQIILVLLLTMLVALSIGLVVTTRSISDVKSSTQTEQAARAFSAAEAGIEEAAQRGLVGTYDISPLDNDALAKVDTKFLPDTSTADYAIEYPPIGREVIAQFWLANPDLDPDTGNGYYINTNVVAYFGNQTGFSSDDEKPALALTFVNYQPIARTYSSYKVYLDSVVARASVNSFTNANCVTPPGAINTTMSQASQFLCSANVAVKKDKTGVLDCTSGNDCVPVLVRARVLYSSEDQKIALKPVAPCPNGSNPTCFPPQVSLFKSTGTSGQSQKTILVFRLKKVVPPWFDYAIFSAGDITK